MPHQKNNRWATPPDETKLWRYRKESHLKDIISNSTLHFSRVHEFLDSYEGSLPKALKHQQLASLNRHGYGLNQIEKEQEARFRLARITSFINCWYMGGSESAAMWDIYGSENKSVAISTTIGDLKDALGVEELPVFMGKVFYVDYTSYLDEMDECSRGAVEKATHRDRRGRDLHENLRMKRKSYQYETEVRLLVPTSDPFDHRPLQWETYRDLEEILHCAETEGKSHYKVDIDLNSLIESIKVNPRAGEDYKTELRGYIRETDGINLSPECVTQSDFTRDPLF